MTKYNYITLGCDCSTASALKGLSLREHSLPFDWIISDMNNVIKCISEEFVNFHRHLKLTPSKTRVIDYYGFEYPHDYPNNNTIEIENVGNGSFDEKLINDDWSDFIHINIQKYDRRAERFLDILKSENDLIVLYRGQISDVIYFKNFMRDKFNKVNIKYIVSNSESYLTDDIISCNTEKNGIWNDISVWEESIKIIM